MRFIYVRLKGYIGLYNGSGLNELVLDMSNCRNKIVLISGMNGSGKSTLQSALDILPDPSSSFVPGRPAEKELHVLDTSGEASTIYQILITSPVSKSGRGVTKASIKKNGVELNPNGNISSYKEIIFSEFELDGNYITLGQLSSTDRGLAGKLPSERKKFMSCIVDNLEVYNNIYKTLNKKSLIFKSSMNNLHTKIQNIGDEGKLRVALSRFMNQMRGIDADIDSVKAKMAIYDNWINLHFSSIGCNQEELERVEAEYTQSSRALKLAKDIFISKASKVNCGDNITQITNLRQSTLDLIQHNNQEIEVLKVKKAGILSLSGSTESDRDLRMVKIQSLMEGVDNNIVDQYNGANEAIKVSSDYLTSIGFDYRKVSIEDIEAIRDAVNEILDLIDQFYMDSAEDVLSLALHDDFEIRYDELMDDIHFESSNADTICKELGYLKHDRELIKSVKSHRPEECKIDTCWYIAAATELSKKYQNENRDIDKEISVLEQRLKESNQMIIYLTDSIPVMDQAKAKRTIYLKICELIRVHRNLLHKYPKVYPKLNTIQNLLRNHYTFSEFRDAQIFTSAISALSSYQRNVELANSLKADIKILENNTAMVNSLQEEVSGLEKKLEEYRIQINSIDSAMRSDMEIVKTSTDLLNRLDAAISAYDNYTSANTKFTEISETYNSIKNANNEAINKIQERNNCQIQLDSLLKSKSELEPQISRINGMLTMLAEYQVEYNQVKEKYRMIELVKKYTSPSSGIQTLFIEVYMNKALDLANQILGMIFSGEYRLLNFVINQNEFRIPFIGSGLPVDDISSGSTSQICIIGMIINLVLLHQASVKFNIPRLDEIDGGLDSRNKLDFINILYKTSDILGIEQMFMISHSAELELQNVDIIRLRSYEDHEINPNFNGTVIFDYNQSISTSGTSI